MIYTTASISTIILFIATTLFTFYSIAKHFKVPKSVLLILAIWLLLQALLGVNGFYTLNNTIPPRFVLMVAPPFLFIVILFNTKKGKAFIDQLEIGKLTLLHTIRIPVEIVLLALYILHLVPKIMTFEGANFDILSGITAPFIYYFILNKSTVNYKILLIWNILCLLLLFIIVGLAILSAPSPFQKLSFEHPNIGVLYFPFNWLPSFIVPVVLFAHLATIRKIINTK